MAERRWYALHVMTGREQEIAEAVEKSGAVNAIVPIRVLAERRKKKLQVVKRVLFPGYVFVLWTGNVTTYYEMLGIPGVIRFVGADKKPIAIPDEQMAPVLILANHGNPIALSQVYREGELTRIVSGPLKDLDAYIVKVDIRNRRATIQIPILNADHTIQLGLEMLRPTSNHDKAQADASPREGHGDHDGLLPAT